MAKEDERFNKVKIAQKEKKDANDVVWSFVKFFV